MQYVPFCDWLISPSAVPSQCVCVIAGVRSSVLLRPSDDTALCGWTTLCLCATRRWVFGLLPFLAAVNVVLSYVSETLLSNLVHTQG